MRATLNNFVPYEFQVSKSPPFQGGVGEVILIWFYWIPLNTSVIDPS